MCGEVLGSTQEDLAVFDLRLYIAGQSPKSLLAIENLRKVCETHLAGRYRVELIDLLENPRLARGDEILAVPTLVRKLPEPVRKITGDLSDTVMLLVALQLRPDRDDGAFVPGAPALPGSVSVKTGTSARRESG